MKMFVLAVISATIALAFAPASAAGGLSPGTYRQLSPTTMHVLNDANQIVFRRNAGGQLQFSINATRALDHNMGYIEGTLSGATPVVQWTDADPTIRCRLTFSALPGMRMKVVQDTHYGDCGFGYGVIADGTYLKTSSTGRLGNMNGP